MASSHKGQHWIPARAYLREWCDPDVPPGHEPFVHLFSRDGTAHRRRAPVNIFKETDLYTIRSADGGRDLRIERGLSDLERTFSVLRREFFIPRRAIPLARYVKLMAFVAAMHARTPTMRDHHSAHWKEVQAMMEELGRNMEAASEEQRRRAGSISLPSRGPSMTLDDVRKITASPMEHTLLPYIEAELPLLLRMSCMIACTKNDPGFITSDNPVVWYDPEAYKRPPMFRTPAFMYPKLQITFPLSPSQLLILVHGRPGLRYVDVGDEVVSEANRLTRAHSAASFVVKREFVAPHWLEVGTLPPDAWENSEELVS